MLAARADVARTLQDKVATMRMARDVGEQRNRWERMERCTCRLITYRVAGNVQERRIGGLGNKRDYSEGNGDHARSGTSATSEYVHR